jgi:hypothetical protein
VTHPPMISSSAAIGTRGRWSSSLR